MGVNTRRRHDRQEVLRDLVTANSAHDNALLNPRIHETQELRVDEFGVPPLQFWDGAPRGAVDVETLMRPVNSQDRVGLDDPNQSIVSAYDRHPLMRAVTSTRPSAYQPQPRQFLQETRLAESRSNGEIDGGLEHIRHHFPQGAARGHFSNYARDTRMTHSNAQKRQSESYRKQMEMFYARSESEAPRAYWIKQ